MKDGRSALTLGYLEGIILRLDQVKTFADLILVLIQHKRVVKDHCKKFFLQTHNQVLCQLCLTEFGELA